MALAAAGIPFRIIPGVTAALPRSPWHRSRHAARGQPRGHFRGRAFPTVRVEDDDFDWAPLARAGRADRALHGDAQSRAHRRGADARGSRAAYAPRRLLPPRRRTRSASLFPHCRTLREEARAQAFEPPAIVVVGDIVGARDRLIGRKAGGGSRAPMTGAMSARAFIISAPRSGPARRRSRLLSLLRFRDGGLQSARRKAGPDYIDLGFHAAAAGAKAATLTAGRCRRPCSDYLGGEAACGADILVSKVSWGCSTGFGARRALRLNRRSRGPVLAACLLVVDVAGQSQSAAAVVRGFAAHDPAVRIAGVVLNRVGSEHRRELSRRCDLRVDIPVLGAVPREKRLPAGTPPRSGASRRAR